MDFIWNVKTNMAALLFGSSLLIYSISFQLQLSSQTTSSQFMEVYHHW